MKKSWWKEGVMYQIYPRSFNDSNGDGVGDLRGIIQKLDYLADLGVSIVWLSPIYDSPNADNGYDIRDYYAINSEFGTMADFDELLDKAHQKGLKILMDLVVNHTSDEHFWFQESRKSTDNPYRDFYHWIPGEEGSPPNNWPSFFGGNAWEYDPQTQSYYLHLFAKKQPDLNWENPQVREEVYKLMRFWLDKGVDGFRMDVIPFISKRMDFESTQIEDFGDIISQVYANGPRIHEFLQEMHREVLAHYDMLSIAEGVGIGQEIVLDYIGEDRREIDMIFHFGHMMIDHGPGGRLDPAPWSRDTFMDIFYQWDKATANGGWTSLYLGNHDFPRMVSRWGDEEKYWYESATLLASLTFTLRGTPTIYQGDEIGMTNVPFEGIEDYRDIEMLNAFHAIHDPELQQLLIKAARIQARDHARTPIQWKPHTHGGFSTHTPWIMANPNYSHINVEDQQGRKNSILEFYKRLIAFRKAHEVLIYGDLLASVSQNPLFSYTRSLEGEKTLEIILNFSAEEQDVPIHLHSCKIVFGNYDSKGEELLREWELRIYERES